MGWEKKIVAKTQLGEGDRQCFFFVYIIIEKKKEVLSEDPLERPDLDDLVGPHRHHQLAGLVHVHAAHLLTHLVELRVGRLPTKNNNKVCSYCT